MVSGAGSVGRELITDLKLDKRYKIEVVVDNKTTWGRYLVGIKIGGGSNDIGQLCDEYDIDWMIFTIPSTSDKDLL